MSNAFVFEVGNGEGNGGAIEVAKMGLSLKDYTNVNATVEQGSMKCSESKVKGVTLAFVGWSSEENTRISCDVDDSFIKKTERVDFFSIGPFEFSENSLFIGLEAEAHFYVGGHIKFGFNIKW